MLFGDNMYFGSAAVDAAYMGDTQVWSAIPADIKAHIARVLADGGTVPEQAKMVSMVKKLIAANLWDNCVFFGLPLGGVKKDGNQYVSKVYDLKANADCLQATGTAQPKYSNGGLLFDGGDDLLSPSITNIANPIRQASNNLSVFYKANLKTLSGDRGIFGRSYSTSLLGGLAWLCYLAAGGKLLIFIKSSNNEIKSVTSLSTIREVGTKTGGFTFDGNALVNGYAGKLDCYVNGMVESTSQTPVNCSSINDIVRGVEMGFNGVGVYNGSIGYSYIIFNKTLTQSDALIVHNIIMGV